MNHLTKLSLTEAKKLLESRQISATELVEEHLNQMQMHKDLNVFITETPDLARQKAAQADLAYKSGSARKLEGIPLAIKDLFCTQGVRTTNGSKILHNFIPQYESTVTSKLFAQGAVMTGKTNMDEFAMGSANITSHYGNCYNTWIANDNPEKLVPGGSSGGSAAAVSACMAYASLGSDTGGSVRQPAAFCGLVGFKPSYGRCSRYGMIAFASSLDQAGVFARNLTDAALISETIMGHDKKDSTSAPYPVPDLSSLINGEVNIRGMKIGIPLDYRMDGLDPEINQLWSEAAKKLQEAGAELIDIDLPNSKHGVASYYVIAPAEASSNLARYDGVRYGLREYKDGMSLQDMYKATRSSGFGKEVRRRIMIGTYVLSAGSYEAYFAKAQKVRQLMAQEFTQAFEKVDVILTPVTPGAAFGFESEEFRNPIKMYLNDIFTIPASMAGLPAISMPAKLNNRGLPLGLQLIAGRFMEEKLFKVAKKFEEIYNFNLIAPGY